MKVVDRAYNIHLMDQDSRTVDPKVAATKRKQYTEQKVSELLGAESLYLCGRTSQVSVHLDIASRYLISSREDLLRLRTRHLRSLYTP